MQLETTFRGLSQTEATTATRVLEKGTQRFERLLEEPSTLRAVIEGGAEVRVTLSLNLRKGELTSLSAGHDLSSVINEGCDKMKAQLVRHRHRRESQRHKPVEAEA